jgi:hypothetical protein
MSMASLYFLPSVVLLIVLLITIPICFLMFSSLRKYRRKRNLLVYTVLALMLSLLAFEAYDQFVGPAIVSITLAGEPFFANRVNPIEVTVENLAGRETSFYLVLKSTNATLVADSPDIIQLNSTAVKIPFNLHSLHEEVTKTVHFQMDDTVTGCIFYPSIERSNHGPIITGGTDRAESVWNNRTGRYTLNLIPGAVI